METNTETEKGKAVIWTDYGTELPETQCILHHGHKYAYIPKYNQLVMHPVIIRDVKGKAKVYAPQQTHGNIPKKFWVELAKAQKYVVSLIYKNAKGDITKCEVTCHGSIDPYIFNNDISPNFQSASRDVLFSKLLEFLLELTDKKMFTFILLGFGFGIPSGALLTIIAGVVFGGS